MIAIRPERPADLPAIRAVVAAAFGRAAEADLVDRLRRDGDLLLSLVAEEDGAILGHIAFSRLLVRTPAGDVSAVTLAPLAVRPDRQRQGIGGRLTEAGHDRLRVAGEALIVVVGHPAYYPRFGYDRARAAGFGSAWQGEGMMALAFAPAPAAGDLVFAPAFADID